MRQSEFKTFGKTLKFNKLFVFKGFYDFLVHYLPMRLEPGP